MRVVVTRIEWDGTMQRRLVDTAIEARDTESKASLFAGITLPIR